MNKRRDHKGRVLYTGETQDKNGQYVYRYTDNLGKRHALRSWRLTESDKIPYGKKRKPSLREMEAEVEKMLQCGVTQSTMTVSELVDAYVKMRVNVSNSTKKSYKTVQGLLQQKPFGKMCISDVHFSDAKMFLVKLQTNDHKKYSTIHSVRDVLNPAFQMAFEDEMIRYNPFSFKLGKLLVNDATRREALSEEDERQFLTFVHDDPYFNKYYDAIFVLLNTGLRISEFCGLTVDDINFEKKTLSITKQLQKNKGGEYLITKTKTYAGRRVLPFTNEVGECLARMVKNRPTLRVEPIICGATRFLYYNRNGMPLVSTNWGRYFEQMVQKHNATSNYQLPNITPHICRHTYCTNMAKRGISLKTLQYLMGHSSASVTMNVYTHLGLEAAEEELNALELKKVMSK